MWHTIPLLRPAFGRRNIKKGDFGFKCHCEGRQRGVPCFQRTSIESCDNAVHLSNQVVVLKVIKYVRIINGTLEGNNNSGQSRVFLVFNLRFIRFEKGFTKLI
jgi:hypothetical protein